MQYTFTLRRETGLALLAGLAVCFVLMFLAGWIVGMETQVARALADTTTVSERPKERRSSAMDEPLLQRRTSADTAATPSRQPTGSPPVPEARAASGEGERESSDRADAQQGFTIQIGAFADSSTAHRLARRVRSDGHSGRVHVEVGGPEPLYHVWVGAYSERASAMRRVQSMRTYTGGAFVTRATP